MLRDASNNKENAVGGATAAPGERRPWMPRRARPRSGPPSSPRRTWSWGLFWCGIALAVLASGSFEASALALVESASEGVETEEIVNQERRTQATRRRLAEHRGLDFSAAVQVAPADVAPALAAHASATVARETGRHRRHQHQSLLI